MPYKTNTLTMPEVLSSFETDAVLAQQSRFFLISGTLVQLEADCCRRAVTIFAHACAVVGQMWPYMAAYIAAQAHPQLDPLLEQNKPSWMDDIKLTRYAPRCGCQPVSNAAAASTAA